MKGLVLYSSRTGNTKRLAERIYEGLRGSGEWDLADVARGCDADGYDVVLLGGWADRGSLDGAALEAFREMDKSGKRVGLFMTMGARVDSPHGQMHTEALGELLEGVDGLGVQTLQGSVAPAVLERLALIPDSMMPRKVKDAMEAEARSYVAPTDGDYEAIVGFFRERL
ncbi:MAG: flavodoxin [Bacteroidetes bacterium]|nr:MAG: flavodoxin [Bacteroidota bacterium]